MSLYSRPTAKRGRSQPASRIGSSLQRVIKSGAIAQLGERFNGIEEVVGSIPSGSTKLLLSRLNCPSPLGDIVFALGEFACRAAI